MNWVNTNNMFQNTNPNYNMFNRMQQQPTYTLPHYEATLLHGRVEAENFMIGPNSQIFLPDADQDIIWWIKTDSTGAKTVTPFDITPHKEPQPVDLYALENRLTALEEQLHAKYNKSNGSKRNNNNASQTNDAE